MQIKPIITVLNQVIKHHVSLTACFNEAQLSPEQKAVCYGVIRWHVQLELIAGELLHKPLKAKNQPVLYYIVLGLFQILYGDTPNHAAVKEIVDAVKKSKFRWAEGLVNKLLRRFIDEQDAILKNVFQTDVGHYAHPQWMVERTNNAAVLDANNQPAPMTLRVNLQKTTRADYVTQLENDAITATVLDSSVTALQLDNPVPVDALPGFHQGLCSVQDEAGQLIVAALDLKPGQRVLDACCAPGSKTGHILEAEPALEKLVALDKDSKRLRMVSDNISRLDLYNDNIELITADAAHVDFWWDKKQFDRILIDAPCSATGVIRRHPDIKLLRRESDIEALQQQQLALLNALWPLLKEGGKLIYSTCSVFEDENRGCVEKFCSSTNATLLNDQQLYPTLNGHDGFYIAILASAPNK
ncbi:MAG: hypothetical protein COB66_05590 [Coxiella sp. (in: Bacteria)]|nr:MAG: hypothetical protein COB66_05590 [Coxiella sp. (in: g-proteobacteria)]